MANLIYLASRIYTGYFIPFSIKMGLSSPSGFETELRCGRRSGVKDIASWSFWIKPTDGSGTECLFSYYQSTSENFTIKIHGNKIVISNNDSNPANDWTLTSVGTYGLTESWINVVVSIDTNEPVDEDRVVVEVNGIDISMTGSYPALGQDCKFGEYTGSASIGYLALSTQQFNGLMAECVYDNGSRRYASDFGVSHQGKWYPKEIDFTFTSGDCFLQFNDSTNLGDMDSPMSNATLQDISAANQSTDTPTSEL